MVKQKSITIISIIIITVMLSSFVLSAQNVVNQVFGATLTKGVVTRQNASAVGTDTAAAGNVTNLNISVAATTGKWQGYYGNASLSSLKLGSAATTSLYTWSGTIKNNLRGLFATTGSNFNFAILNMGTSQSYDLALGYIENGAYWSDADTVVNTMASGSQYVIFNTDDVGKTSVVNLTSFDNGANTSSKFSVGVFVDRTDSSLAQTDFAVGVNISYGPYRSFDNQTDVSYELIVPLNASSASTGQTYYFYLVVK